MSEKPTEPIRKGMLPATPPAEWDFRTVFGARSETGGCALFPGDTGPVVIRRRVTYGDWEPVRPDRWAEERPSDAALAEPAAPSTPACCTTPCIACMTDESHDPAPNPAATAVPSVPADASLRDRIARTIRAWLYDPKATTFGAGANAVLAVLTAPADQTAEEGRLRAKVYEWQGSYLDEVKVRQGRDTVIARVRQMVDAWEQRLPETIRTATAVDAIRHALDSTEPPSAPADRAVVGFGRAAEAELYVLLRKAGEDRHAAQALIDQHRDEVLRRKADEAQQAEAEAPLSPYMSHPVCGFHWHGRDGMDVPIRDGQPVCPRCELRTVRATALRDAADELAGIDFHPNARVRSLELAAGLARRLRRMADEAQQAEPEPPVIAYSSVGSVFCTSCIDDPSDPTYRAARIRLGELRAGRRCDECGTEIPTGTSDEAQQAGEGR